MVRHVVFVGGIADGQHLAFSGPLPTEYQMSILRDKPLSWPHDDPPPAEHQTYTLRIIRASHLKLHKNIPFYAPKERTDAEALEALVSNYCGPVK